MSKPIIFRFDPSLVKEAKYIMDNGYVGKAIEKVKDQHGDVPGWHVHLTPGERTDYTLHVYPMSEEEAKAASESMEKYPDGI